MRTALAGLGGTNERRPELADKAVPLLDPFAAWTDHGRLATSDLLLAAGSC